MRAKFQNGWFQLLLGLVIFGSQAAVANDSNTLQTLKTGWEQPARTYKPHTRWWWLGNALTKADITWQLEQMAAQGMGGVEIMSTWKIYDQGNVEYLSPEFIAGHRIGAGSKPKSGAPRREYSVVPIPGNHSLGIRPR